MRIAWGVYVESTSCCRLGCMHHLHSHMNPTSFLTHKSHKQEMAMASVETGQRL